ncbi:hypothetical protein ASPVEDRAFT_35372 [Aspergillus versicolor CBS 583.65]|uniref:Zn(2)-C6 fungal-type domain-containing protein n=1 Tax=Aspergillus versicolor CBS 583.65 TaxID=1036611 RepID=A0A1L9P3M7_ASPVE|nr:uncharacterized protein ASPVEDRAFT_35372 [Aspergillus versicolor CBS 583.65]OJI96044.1 hypothetical protein ASPVEDRAFT_35372 [Aspergillus versicolor CBS 583.65]
MAAQAQAEPYKPKRTSNACIACRQSKIKCSGADPCANCQRRGIECHYTDANKVMVDERYLQELIQQAKGHQTPQRQEPSPGSKRSADVAFGSVAEVDTTCSVSTGPHQEELPAYHTISPEHNVWTNPFTLPSRTVNGLYKGKSGWIWLAPTSLWSLTTRLSLMMAENLHLESPYKVPSSLDKEVYPLRWRSAPAEDPPDISGLPSIDDALYLFNTVKHHLDQHYRFFDEESFTARLQEFYSGNSLQKATENRLWFVHFLLVLAFGNAFLLRSRNTKDAPGSKFFLRAMSLMPDYTNLWTDGLLAVEVLALTGLYLYSIDHRESAHVYIGQAIRIAQLDGLHTELPEEELGADTVDRCRNLWWTLYVMDRHVSSSLGLPMTTQDSDITTVLKPANTGSRRDATLSLHVKLSYLFSSILTTIYKNEKTELGAFLDKTRTILQTMTVYAREIEEIVHPKTSNSVETMPKGTRYITLLYHQCVFVATRPLLLSVLKERLERSTHGVEEWQSFLAPTKALISTGIKSALKTLQILTDENSLLEVFLPFEMEVTYGAALHLMIANTLFPHSTDSTPGYSWSHEAHSILDEMVSKGNMLAAARKTELSHLESLFKELAARIERAGLQALTLATPEGYMNAGAGAAENVNVNANVMGSAGDIHPVDAQGYIHSQGQGHPNHHHQLQHPHMHDPTGVIDPALGMDAHAHTHVHGPYGDLHSSPSSLPHLANSAELLSEIGISSYEFLSIIEQIGGSESSVLDPSPSWKGSV